VEVLLTLLGGRLDDLADLTVKLEPVTLAAGVAGRVGAARPAVQRGLRRAGVAFALGARGPCMGAGGPTVLVRHRPVAALAARLRDMAGEAKRTQPLAESSTGPV